MRKRYPHYLEPVEPSTGSRIYVCFAGKSMGYDGDVRIPYIPDKMQSWRCITVSVTNGVATWCSRGRGTDADSWWRYLFDELVCYHALHILSSRCSRQWHLSGLYDVISDGQLSLRGENLRPPAKDSTTVRAVRHGDSRPLQTARPSGVPELQEARSGFMILEDPPTAAVLWCPSQRKWVTWLDTRNFGVEPPPHVAGEDGEAAWLADWIERVEGLNHELGLGRLRLTGGSQAFNGWRQSYYEGGVYCHVNDSAGASELAGYSGGRCECYRIGVTQARQYHADVRSLYPSVCIAANLPGQLDCVFQPGDRAASLPTDVLARSIARVKIDTDEPAYPYRRGADTIYPVGRFSTVLCGPELVDAASRGRLLAIGDAATYRMTPVLSAYMETMYAARMRADSQGNAGLSSYIKKLLVTLPGKIGQKDRHWQLAPEVWCDEQWCEFWGHDADRKPVRYRSLGGTCYRDTIGGVSYDSCPAISAWITSLGRMRLLGLIRLAGWKNVLYVDTDAIICSAAGYDALRTANEIRNGELGYLRLIDGGKDCTVWGIKHYAMGDKFVAAGIRKGICEDVGDGIHYWHTPAPADEIAGKRRPRAERMLRRYAACGPYRHGNVGSDGVVTPIRLEEF